MKRNTPFVTRAPSLPALLLGSYTNSSITSSLSGPIVKTVSSRSRICIPERAPLRIASWSRIGSPLTT
jgi:hypothetical protein